MNGVNTRLDSNWIPSLAAPNQQFLVVLNIVKLDNTSPQGKVCDPTQPTLLVKDGNH